MVETARRRVASAEIAGAKPAVHTNVPVVQQPGHALDKRGTLVQFQPGAPFLRGPMLALRLARHTVTECEESSTPAVTRSLTGASPVGHPRGA